MIKATFTDYITVHNGMVARYVLATWGKTRSHSAGKTAVYREFENGKKQVRRLCYHPISGYMVDKDYSANWCSAIIECRALSDGYSVYGRDITDEEVDAIVSVHPNFRWTLQKAGRCNCAKALKLLQQWLRNPNVELLVAAHYDRLAMNRSFIRYGRERQMKVLKFVRENPGSENWPLQKIKFVMDGHTAKEYDDWKSFRDVYDHSFSYDSYKYLSSRKNMSGDLELYRDYIAMAKECGHDIKDKYWYAPKNLHKAHEKVMAEVELVREAKRQERAELAKKETELKMDRFRKVGKKFCDMVTRFHGLTAYVPQDTNVVDRHAKALSQCLVYADYIGKMASQRCLLVFIVDENDKPVATAEILPGGKLGQFYGNEKYRDPKRMKPNEDAENLIHKWLRKFSDSNMKLNPRKDAA